MKQTKFNESLLIEVLAQQSYSEQTKEFRKWILNHVRKYPNVSTFVDNGNLYVTKGASSLYPCIVAHTDTVHKVNPYVEIYKSGLNLFAFDRKAMEQYGIGGDDKVGVFICLEMLERLPEVKMAFFRDEEIGCIGSKKAKVEWFEDCSFVLQCDRRGHSDFIDSINGADICSKEWKAEIKPIIDKYGYSFDDGMMTDVEALKIKNIPLCMNNMSCGYYNPHTSREYVNLAAVKICTDMVFEIMTECSYKKWEHKYDHKQGYYNADYTRGSTTYGLWSGSTTSYANRNDDFYKNWEYVSGKGWIAKNKPDANLAPAKIVADPKKVAAHGAYDNAKACPMCRNIGMTYDAHQEDWFCWYCEMYENQLTAERLMKQKKNDDIDTIFD